MATQLYTYSLIRSLYDQGDDLIDSFWPLVIKVLPTDRSASPLETVQVAVEEKYGLSMPQHSLGTIITRAARKGFVERRDKRISLTQAGVDFYHLKLEPEREAERRVNELLVDANEFLKSNRQSGFSAEKIKEMIQAFVLENLEALEQFFNPENVQTKEKREFPTDAEKVLLDYFVSVERTKPAIFRTLQDIVCGSIISAILHTSELLKESGKRFERTAVYLDSNYIFSLLNLRYDEENKPAQELFELMKKEAAFEFRVFDFTLHEITSLLKNYEKEERYYQPHIKVRGSLFASLKAKGWSAAKVKEFVVNIEGQLWDKLGTTITPTDINLKTYEPGDPKRRELLGGYKGDQGIKEQNHDLAAIDHIRNLRRKQAKRIEKCQAMFLTSDMKLALYNYIAEEHKENDTISEVIPDRLLTNILWLKNPGANGKLSLDSIIAFHSRSLFVDQTVWKQFYRNVAELRSEGSLDDKQVSILLYDRHIQEVLSEYDSDEAEEIDPTMILKDIEKLRSESQDNEPIAERPVESMSPHAPILELVEAPADDVSKQLTDLREEVRRLRRERNEMEINTIERWKKLRELEAETEAKVWTALVKVAIVLVTVGISVFLINPVRDRWETIEPIAWLMIPVVASSGSLLGIRLDPFQWSARLYARVFNIVLRRKLRGLERAEMNFEVDTQNEG